MKAIELEKSYRIARRSKDEDSRMILLSLEPILSMLDKLMSRKENGKKPFSTFSAKEAIGKIEETEKLIQTWIEKKHTLEEKDLNALKTIEGYCDLAIQEIRMESMKQDFLYLKDSVALAREFLR